MDQLNIDQMIDLDLIICSSKSSNQDEILKQLSQVLKNKGLVKSSFYQAILDREEEFPTGLSTQTINVAMPHTDAEHVNNSAIAIAVLNEPIQFYSMDGSGKKIPVEIIFMLAVKEKKAQSKLLKKLITAFQDEEFLTDVKAASTKERVVKVINRYFAE